jgi:ATP-dependent RNA helicase DDX46/PRP5
VIDTAIVTGVTTRVSTNADGGTILLTPDGPGSEQTTERATKDHNSRSSRQSLLVQPSADEIKAQRLARLQEWKNKKLAAAAENQKPQSSTAMTRSLLDEIDKKTAAIESPVAASPRSDESPDTPGSPATPYAGKFDPKAIAKKAAAQTAASTKLGTDVALPASSKASAPPTSVLTRTSANGGTASKAKQNGMLAHFRLISPHVAKG